MNFLFDDDDDDCPADFWFDLMMKVKMENEWKWNIKETHENSIPYKGIFSLPTFFHFTTAVTNQKISNETFGQPKVETKNNNNNFFIESLKINCVYYVIEIV